MLFYPEMIQITKKIALDSIFTWNYKGNYTMDIKIYFTI